MTPEQFVCWIRGYIKALESTPGIIHESDLFIIHDIKQAIDQT